MSLDIYFVRNEQFLNGRLNNFWLFVVAAEVMKSLNIPKGVRRVLFRTLNTDR